MWTDTNNEEISELDTVYIRAGNLGNISSSFLYQILKFRLFTNSFIV